MRTLTKQESRHLAGFFLLGVVAVVGWLLWVVVYTDTGTLQVHFLDVGQGDAMLIETPSGGQMLVDAGRARSVSGSLSNELPIFDRTLNVVAATHPDSDHIGGLPAVLADYRVDQVILPEQSTDTATYRAFKVAGNKEGAEGAGVTTMDRGDVISFGDGVYLLALSARNQMLSESRNDSSLVFKLIYGDTSLLAAGDLESDGEQELVSRFGSFLDADILKVSHHGSDSSSGSAFLSAVSPTHAVISAGADNTYGHPHQVVLDRLKTVDAAVICTCDVVTVSFESDGKSFTKI